MTSRRNRAVSMADVAARAGVSTQTVSRVTNGVGAVAPATRERVLSAMRSLGYRPNAAARALKRGSFRSIGVVMFDLTKTGNVATLAAISDAATALGYTVTLVTERSRTSASVSSAFTRLQEMAVDGLVLVIDSIPDDGPSYRLPRTLPLVVLDSTVVPGHARIDTDQTEGARLGVEHLIELGHATVHHLAGPLTSSIARQREASWHQVLLSHNLQVPPAVYGDWTSLSGYRGAASLLEDPGCTAVFCANDEMALGLMHAAQDAGRSVPGDLSVVGFDDIPLAGDVTPPLTTVHQDFTEMGRACITRLATMIATDESDTATQLIPTSLVVRASTAPPRSTARTS